MVGKGDEGSYVVCTTLFMWLPKMVLPVVGGGMDDEGMGGHGQAGQQTTGCAKRQSRARVGLSKRDRCRAECDDESRRDKRAWLRLSLA